MTCRYKGQIKKYLEEELTREEMLGFEGHLDKCSICQGEIDRFLDIGLNLGSNMPQVEDEILIKKIKARVKGVRRIGLYGFLGFLIGLFSPFYTLDKFLPTKALLALPYKLAEFTLSIFFSGNILPFGTRLLYDFQGRMGFFPFNPVLDLLATTITPALVASFIAMVVGYLGSDRKVFQRKNISKFLGIWLVVLLVWLSALYGGYSYTLNKIDHLEGIKGMTVYTADKNGTSWLIRLDSEALSADKYRELINIISEGEDLGKKPYPLDKEGYEISVDFVGGGTIPIYIEMNYGKIHLLNGDTYQLLPEKLEKIPGILGRDN